MWVLCLNNVKCIIFVPGAQEGQRRTSDPLELQLQMIVTHHVENLAPVFLQVQQMLLPLSHLSSPNPNFSSKEVFVLFTSINLLLFFFLNKTSPFFFLFPL